MRHTVYKGKKKLPRVVKLRTPPSMRLMRLIDRAIEMTDQDRHTYFFGPRAAEGRAHLMVQAANARVRMLNEIGRLESLANPPIHVKLNPRER